MRLKALFVSGQVSPFSSETSEWKVTFFLEEDGFHRGREYDFVMMRGLRGDFAGQEGGIRTHESSKRTERQRSATGSWVLDDEDDE